LLVDIENSDSVLATVAKLLLEFDDIYKSSKYTIKHWYKDEWGKTNRSGREGNQEEINFYGIMNLWEFPDLKKIYGDDKVDLKSVIKQTYANNSSGTEVKQQTIL